MSTVRIGLFGIGLDTYWPQFKGLKRRLEGYVERVCRKLARPGVEVVNLGLIDSPQAAFEAGHRFRREDVDLIFLYVTTYALSSTVLPVVQRAKVPVIILNLAPEAAIMGKNAYSMLAVVGAFPTVAIIQKIGEMQRPVRSNINALVLEATTHAK